MPFTMLRALPTVSLAALATLAPAQRQPATADGYSWFDTLPNAYRQSILWFAAHEVGSMYEWDFGGDGDAGGGIFNTGGNEVIARATTAVAHSGRLAAEATITNAYRAQNGKRAVRLMRWTDTHWRHGGDYFPDRAYYSAWYYFPTTYNPNKYPPWDPGDGGWWNVFQFKSDDHNGVSQPMWSLNVEHDDDAGVMQFYLWSGPNPPNSFSQASPLPVPVGEWVHIEALYEVASDRSGRIAIWQDGVPILDVRGVQTVLPGSHQKPIWGIGNYTDHIDGGSVGGTATVYFDDAAVSTRRLSELITWADLGHGLGGAHGVPRLQGHGTLSPATTVAITLDDAAPSSPSALILGSARVDLPWLGGTLVPRPDFALPTTTTNGGTARWALTPPATLDRALGLRMQAWVLDASGPAGASASNALDVTGS